MDNQGYHCPHSIMRHSAESAFAVKITPKGNPSLIPMIEAPMNGSLQRLANLNERG